MAIKTPVKSARAVAAKKPAVPVNKVAAKVTANVTPKASITAAKTTKAIEAKVSKVVRDSFTMTTADHDLLKGFKKEAAAAGRINTKKSEVVRAALQQFATLSVAARAAAIGAVPPVKIGRPKQKK
jgi:hypothetical protein